MKSPIGTICKENYNVYNGDFKFSSIHWNTLFLLVKFSKQDMKVSYKVLLGLVAGVIFGFALQALYGAGSVKINGTLE
jgi:L-cystine uptake protein TcyP (sodium:dicarboxylate symporter family)